MEDILKLFRGPDECYLYDEMIIQTKLFRLRRKLSPNQNHRPFAPFLYSEKGFAERNAERIKPIYPQLEVSFAFFSNSKNFSRDSANLETCHFFSPSLCQSLIIPLTLSAEQTAHKQVYEKVAEETSQWNLHQKFSERYNASYKQQKNRFHANLPKSA